MTRFLISLIVIYGILISDINELRLLYLTQLENIRLLAIVNEISRVTVSATGYNAVMSQTDDTPGITSCLSAPTVGSIAVSQDLYYNGWTCGKKVHIEGLGIFTIKDVMHFRKKKQIDIVFNTESNALKFGYIFNRRAVLLTNYERMDSMKKQKTETIEQFELRRSEKCHQIRTENGYFDTRPKKLKPASNRVSITQHPKYWRYFFTRTTETINGVERYKYKAKKDKRIQDLIESAKFLAAHGRYKDYTVVV